MKTKKVYFYLIFKFIISITLIVQQTVVFGQKTTELLISDKMENHFYPSETHLTNDGYIVFGRDSKNGFTGGLACTQFNSELSSTSYQRFPMKEGKIKLKYYKVENLFGTDYLFIRKYLKKENQIELYMQKIDLQSAKGVEEEILLGSFKWNKQYPSLRYQIIYNSERDLLMIDTKLSSSSYHSIKVFDSEMEETLSFKKLRLSIDENPGGHTVQDFHISKSNDLIILATHDDRSKERGPIGYFPLPTRPALFLIHEDEVVSSNLIRVEGQYFTSAKMIYHDEQLQLFGSTCENKSWIKDNRSEGIMKCDVNIFKNEVTFTNTSYSFYNKDWISKFNKYRSILADYYGQLKKSEYPLAPAPFGGEGMISDVFYVGGKIVILFEEKYREVTSSSFDNGPVSYHNSYKRGNLSLLQFDSKFELIDEVIITPPRTGSKNSVFTSFKTVLINDNQYLICNNTIYNLGLTELNCSEIKLTKLESRFKKLNNFEWESDFEVQQDGSITALYSFNNGLGTGSAARKYYLTRFELKK